MYLFFFFFVWRSSFFLIFFLKEPDGYKEFRKHLHKDGFLQTMETEKDNFVLMNT